MSKGEEDTWRWKDLYFKNQNLGPVGTLLGSCPRSHMMRHHPEAGFVDINPLEPDVRREWAGEGRREGRMEKAVWSESIFIQASMLGELLLDSITLRSALIKP